MKVTGYEGYTQTQLHTLFSTEKWEQLSFEDRINACQEVENRYASENGVAPCEIKCEQMNGASYGWQNGNTICLNTSLVRDGVFITSYTDQFGQKCQIETAALAPSWNTLDTVYHEGTHGIQQATGRMPNTYISPSMDGDLYRIQGVEKEAYAVGQSRTLDAISEVENTTGKYDASRDDYFASVRNDSFQAALQDASNHYNDPDIENTLQNVISDREYGISQNNPSSSYQAINDLCDNNGLHSSADVSNSATNNVDSNNLLQSQEEQSNIFNDDQPVITKDDGISQTSSVQTEGYTADDGISQSSAVQTEGYTADDGIFQTSTVQTEGYTADDGIESSTYSESNNLSEIDDGISSYTNDTTTSIDISNDSSGMSVE